MRKLIAFTTATAAGAVATVVMPLSALGQAFMGQAFMG